MRGIVWEGAVGAGDGVLAVCGGGRNCTGTLAVIVVPVCARVRGCAVVWVCGCAGVRLRVWLCRCGRLGVWVPGCAHRDRRVCVLCVM